MDDIKSVENDVKIVDEESMQPVKMHIGKTWRCVCVHVHVLLFSPDGELELAGHAFSTAWAPGQYVFA